ncbi:hypothetical protein RI444_08480 [Paenarthrobacter sp. AT5]|uniref:hypothetical protein n=1 Tax=Paenarthrobacter TaxID=1742992 RepID=UPI001A996A16|nr:MULTISPECIES: hypothetical protein [Paenarthrobacter]QSZ54353.1 hypothetical protein AYX19_16095 [Paenarthrobacter ureafaciens]WOC62635.1 hypothetical protein RI444_08480 [Paenarthrobacter sp. AT5]
MYDNAFTQAQAAELLQGMVQAPVSTTPPQNGAWANVDGPSLLSAASSLQLISSNAHFLTRLQRLAAAAARIPENPKAQRLSSSLVKKLLADPFVSGSDVLAQEDPYEGIYVAEVPYTGGARLVIEGISEGGGARIASTLLSAVSGAADGVFPEGYVVRVKALARCLLDLSHTVCVSAGLERGSTTLDRGRAVTVPSAGRLAALSHHVRFDVNRLWADLPDYVREYVSDMLVQDTADVPAWREGEVIDDGIILKPLIRSGNSLVLASPGHLMACLRHHIISESHEWGCSEALATALCEATAHGAWSLLSGMCEEPLEVTASSQGYIRSVGTFDQDKTLDLICLVDDLTEYDQSTIFQPWQAPALSERVHEIFAAADSAPEKTLRIVVYQGVGRDMMFGIPSSDTPAPTLFLPFDDLEVILQSPGTDRMTLWYFAVSWERLEREVHVLHFSAVDVFAFYREHHDSFYIDDGVRPGMISFDPGYGQKLRIDNYRRINRHWVIDPQTRVLSEAYAVHGRRSSPVHLVVGSKQSAMIVDTGEIHVWVRLARTTQRHGATSTYDLGQAVAFWAWQLLMASPALLAPRSVDGRAVEIEVALHEPGSGAQTLEEPWISVQEESSGRLTLRFGDLPPADDNAPMNYLDREMVKSLLEALVPAATEGSTTRDELLERVAPAGPKQMIHVYGGGADEVVLPGNLPEARRLQSAPVARLLDDLGHYLTSVMGLAPGPIEKDQRTAFLNEKVTRWLMDNLHDTVGQLNREGLLEKLITLDEALASETAREPAQLRARLACFGPRDDQVQTLQKHQSTAVASSLASRFIIEYVTAFTPSGTLPLTDETYDHLLALGSEIINKGMLSDALRHNISDAEIGVLESGRLGISRDEDKYHAALTHFGNTRAHDTFTVAVAGLQESSDDSTDPLEEADFLAEGEFGFSYTDLAQACRQIIALGDDGAFKDVVKVHEDDVREVLKTELGWQDTKVEALLAAASLSHTATTAEEYWRNGTQVFPWRFNRDLSYLRRPLLRRVSPGGTELVSGRRRLWQTASFWLEQFKTGRLQAKTKPMKAALNKIRSAKGDSFELAVAASLTAAGLSGVRSRLNRVGRHDFRNIDGADLGDIDAIGVDQQHRQIYVVEAKDFEVARTPAELANEIDNLLLSDKAAVKRLALRADWVRRHIPTTLTELGVTAQKGSWTVVPLVIVDERLLSARLSSSEFPILGIAEVETYLRRNDRPARRGR